MILTDTHCHLYLDHFNDDISEVLERAVANRIKNIFLPAIDWTSIGEMDKLTHPDISFYKMAGVHPCHVEENLPVLREQLEKSCNRDDIVGVGETGLDYYWSTDYIEEQKRSLRLHCDVAKQTNKPIVLHNRESTTDLLDIIEEEQDGSLTGVWHCFTGTLDEGKRALDLGLYLGVGGVSTFKNAGVDNVVKDLPIDRLILETDAPYLTPAPHRGERNEPAYIKIIAENLAKLMNLSLKEVASATTKNAFDLFQIDPADG